jgi:hypothetical protein
MRSKGAHASGSGRQAAKRQARIEQARDSREALWPADPVGSPATLRGLHALGSLAAKRLAGLLPYAADLNLI